MIFSVIQYHFENKSIVFCTKSHPPIKEKTVTEKEQKKSAATVSFATANCLNRSGTIFLFLNRR